MHHVTLETAIKLKEAGIEFKDSLFKYMYYSCASHLIADVERHYKSFDPVGLRILPAPILTELLERLPKVLIENGRYYFKCIDTAGDENYYASYDDSNNVEYRNLQGLSTNPCEAAAQLLLKLKKEGLI